MTKASDNAFPSVLLTEGGPPAAPASGKQRLWTNSSNLNMMTAAGVQRVIGGASVSGAVDNCAVVARTAGDVVITQTAWTDLTGMTVTLTTGAHRCRVIVNFIYATNNAANFMIDIDVDGTGLGGTLGCWSIYSGAAIISQPCSFTFLTPVLSSASHTISFGRKVLRPRSR